MRIPSIAGGWTGCLLLGALCVASSASAAPRRSVVRPVSGAARGDDPARGDHANDCVAGLKARGLKAEALSVDVTDAAALESVPAGIIDRHGRLDIVVNNAGITRDQLLMRMKREDWDAVMATNLTATFVLAQAAMRPMLRQRGGRIIAVSSVVGQMGNAGQTN